ncbi:MAG: radical SAM protein, partial [Nanoarchaeota archaeon]
HRPYIDFVVAGQGESALEGIIRKDPSQSIPQLTYREGSVIITNSQKRLPLHLIPVPSRKYIDLANYSKRFQKTLESKLTGLKCFTTIRTQDGCLKAIREGVCTFCKRDDLFLAGFRKPDTFWDEISYLESLGVDYAWDIAASFTTVGSKYLWSLAKKRPSESKIRFRVYARADDLSHEENVEALAALGVENVLVGFDSGDQICLDASNKKTTLEQHRQAAHNLRKYGIATYAGFVLGHLAETKQSMHHTLYHAQELKGILGNKLFRTTTCSKMQLYPGTVEWHRYCETFPEEQEYYENADDIDLQLLSKKYFRKYLHLEPYEADEFAQQIRCLSPIKSGKDLKKSVVDEYLKEIHIM